MKYGKICILLNVCLFTLQFIFLQKFNWFIYETVRNETLTSVTDTIVIWRGNSGKIANRTHKIVTDASLVGGGALLTNRKFDKDFQSFRQNGYKTIVLLNKVFIKLGSEQFNTCPHRNCYVTEDTGQLEVSDAVLVNMGHWPLLEIRKLQGLPRKADQYWIFFLRESQLRFEDPEFLRQYNGYFNLTMTFKRDSDIWQPYNYYKKLDAPIRFPYVNYAKGKSKLLAWVVSHCDGFARRPVYSERGKYFDELRKYIPADKYGKCNNSFPCIGDCLHEINKEYKFYFAAENSLCKDYITEKAFRSIGNGIVPIVLGGANYSSLMPHHSFIDVTDFKSPKHLAEYLITLDQNDDLYNQYFSWKPRYVMCTTCYGFCKLCEYLNKNNNERKVHLDINTFMNKSIDCLSAKEYYKGHYGEQYY